MKIEFTQLDGIMIVHLSEKMDLYSHRELAETFEDVKLKDINNFIINLSGIDIISSSGVGLILRYHSELKKIDKRMVLSSLSPVCARVFELLQLTDAFDIYDNDEQAIQEFNNATG